VGAIFTVEKFTKALGALDHPPVGKLAVGEDVQPLPLLVTLIPPMVSVPVEAMVYVPVGSVVQPPPVNAIA
jgi:hypothetical protein